ncbi:MAG: hypothetical protein RRA34_04920 [Candidatus Calditenuis sp.]|nr:hypothetical protein [Candidatus Calditenuis sp.]
MRAKAFLLLLVLLALLPAALGADALLAVSSTEGGKVSVSGPIIIEGPGIYRTVVGAEITLLAVAEERWAFDRWISDDPAINGSTANPLTIRVNSTSMRITAAFRPLYEKVEFVRVFVSSPVPISYPEIVLKGRRVVISAPEVFVSKDREDIRYVFSAWILNGTVIRSSVVSFIATSDVNLTAVYRKEFRFMGEWFRIEEGVALQQVEHELAPGVIGKASCHRNVRLNVTLCVTKGEVYVPKDLLPDFQPVYEKYYLVTIRVVGVPEAEVFVNGERHVVAPTKEIYVKEGTLTVDVQPRVGDYVLQGENSVVVNLRSPTTLTFYYELDPLSRFHPFLRSVGALILASPIGEPILSMPDPLPNVLAIAPFAAVAAGSALSVRALSKRLKREKKEEVVELGESVLRESPRQVGYSRMIEQTIGRAEVSDPELKAILAEDMERRAAEARTRQVAAGKPLPVRRALEEGKKGAAVEFRDLVSEAQKLREEELRKLVELGVLVVGEPEPIPFDVPEEGVVALIGGDGRSYFLKSRGIRVVPSWSVRPEELRELVGPRKKKEVPVIALSWCDLLEPHEVLAFSATASSEKVKLLMLFDDPDAAPPIDSVKLQAPPKDLLRSVAIAEMVRAGRLDVADAELAAELSSRLPGLQLAFARAFGRNPLNPLEALESEKLGMALRAVQEYSASGLGLSRRALEGWLANTLKAYGGMRMLKYREKVVDRLVSIMEVIGEWR